MIRTCNELEIVHTGTLLEKQHEHATGLDYKKLCHTYAKVLSIPKLKIPGYSPYQITPATTLSLQHHTRTCFKNFKATLVHKHIQADSPVKNSPYIKSQVRPRKIWVDLKNIAKYIKKFSQTRKMRPEP